MLTVYTNHLDGTFVYENKAIKFDVERKLLARKYTYIQVS